MHSRTSSSFSAVKGIMCLGRVDASGSPVSHSNTPRLKVIVVDDERDLADISASLLQLHEVDVLIAYSGAEALSILAIDAEVDAVISDIMMPEMTGLELARTVADRYPHIKIILTSGYTHRSLFSGAPVGYNFVHKPYRIEVLLRLLHRALDE
jgi:two-component system OmpR family response regulator